MAAVTAAVEQAQPPLEAAFQEGRGGGLQLQWGWKWGAAASADADAALAAGVADI